MAQWEHLKLLCYQSGGPPSLPLAVMVHFDLFKANTFRWISTYSSHACIRRTWLNSGQTCSRMRLPLKVAWAITIHISQGLILNKAIIDIGKKEFSIGLTFVACSRLCHLKDLLFHPPFNYEHLTCLSRSCSLHERRAEDDRVTC